MNDDLTAREREVLELVDLGLTNEEIAERLGISLDGAKYHVSQILSKLGVSSRADAGSAVTARRPARGLVWASLALSAAAAAVVIGVLTWGAVTSGSGDSDDVGEPGESPLDGAPRISDHWHASYTFYACGEKQPNAPTWEGVGVHTHGDGIMHIHPFIPNEEGAGARMVKWFEYGGGLLDEDAVRLPGLSRTWRNGDVCPDGTPEAGQVGLVQVFANGEKLEDWSDYIPRDGDRLRMVFGSEEKLAQLDDRLVIDQSAATRTVDVRVIGVESETVFTPQRIELSAGETVRLHLVNEADVSHALRVAGADGQYETVDDFVVTAWIDESSVGADILEPGEEGFTVIRFDDPGEYEFKDPTATNLQTQDSFAVGTIVVGDGPTPTPTPSPP